MVCGYFGHLYPGRGIEIVEQLSRARPDCLFLVYGGTERDLDERRLGNRLGNLIFMGHVPHPRAGAHGADGCPSDALSGKRFYRGEGPRHGALDVANEDVRISGGRCANSLLIFRSCGRFSSTATIASLRHPRTRNRGSTPWIGLPEALGFRSPSGNAPMRNIKCTPYLDSACRTYPRGSSGSLMRSFFILVPSPHPTGPVKGACALANALAPSRRVVLVFLKPGPGVDAALDDRVERVTRRRGWRLDVVGLRHIARCLQPQEGDHGSHRYRCVFSADTLNRFVGSTLLSVQVSGETCRRITVTTMVRLTRRLRPSLLLRCSIMLLR